MIQQQFIKQRDQWLEEVSNTCHTFALEINLDFYVFQTPCNQYRPEMLIIGINPGGGKSYAEALQEKGYSQRPSTDLGYDVNVLTTKPSWENGEKGGDVLRLNLARLFNDKNGLSSVLKDSVMMNMVYFNTTQEKGLNDIPDEYKEYCINKTLEFVEILNPKHILFLTSESKVRNYRVTNIHKVENFVKVGTLDGRKVFVIPHYGYRGAWSYENCSKMGKTLSKEFSLP